MLAVAVNCCKITKMTITIVNRNLADKYSHRFITGLEGAKADDNTTLTKINRGFTKHLVLFEPGYYKKFNLNKKFNSIQ